MNRSIFGWDLPPGCTSGDIERAAGGGQPDIVEAFTSAHKGKLTTLQEEQLSHPDLYEDASIADLVEKFYSWAYGNGQLGAREDDGLYAEYLAQKHIDPVLFKVDVAKAAAQEIARLML